MLEFELKRSKKGKRSRWSKKYPRKRISHRGDEKYAHWFPYKNIPIFVVILKSFLWQICSDL